MAAKAEGKPGHRPTDSTDAESTPDSYEKLTQIGPRLPADAGMQDMEAREADAARLARAARNAVREAASLAQKRVKRALRGTPVEAFARGGRLYIEIPNELNPCAKSPLAKPAHVGLPLASVVEAVVWLHADALRTATKATTEAAFIADVEAFARKRGPAAELVGGGFSIRPA